MAINNVTEIWNKINSVINLAERQGLVKWALLQSLVVIAMLSEFCGNAFHYFAGVFEIVQECYHFTGYLYVRVLCVRLMNELLHFVIDAEGSCEKNNELSINSAIFFLVLIVVQHLLPSARCHNFLRRFQ